MPQESLAMTLDAKSQTKEMRGASPARASCANIADAAHLDILQIHFSLVLAGFLLVGRFLIPIPGVARLVP